MLKWLKTANPSLAPSTTEGSKYENTTSPTANPSMEPSATPGLPKPLETENPRMTAAANREVERVMAESGSRKRKRGNYGNYSPEMRAKIAKLCLDIGASKAARQLSKETGRQINESTVRSIKTSYVKEKQRLGTDNVENLPRRNVGRPLKLGGRNEQMGDYVRNLRKAGGVVNRRVVMGAARGLLSEHGGSVEITSSWANSFLRRMNFQARRNESGEKIPEDFEQTKEGRIEVSVREDKIPDVKIAKLEPSRI
ncbi:PREDICTED: uncharacterized protein LOC109470058 [Branchiostoma belcheri]|uniref:Uncharacterized protein LOC109470058 n=1 Tax=Branchiostoma belcheri TaxID=7741 RepID=A0A6P4YZZ5_BRABE|nr:PREDICTED: uncharacterized protein LOC109470058 [Branchiostoma belcheri]